MVAGVNIPWCLCDEANMHISKGLSSPKGWVLPGLAAIFSILFC